VPDAVVIGGGHNGLVAANILADQGWEVVVLEAAGAPGGAVKTGEITVPGYHHDLFSAFYPLAAASPVLSSLALEEYGLVWRHAPLVLAHALPNGEAVAVSRDLEETAASLDAHHRGDGDSWRQMFAKWQQMRRPLLDSLLSPFPPLRPATKLAALLGPLEMVRFARQMVLPVRRFGEEQFGGLGARLLLAGNALHADIAPDTAGSAAFGWLLSCLAQDVGFPVPEGGAGRLIAALVARLQARDGQVHCGRAVAQVVVRRGRAVAVRTAAGEEIDVRRAVLAAVSAPALYLDLVESGHMPAAVLADIRRFQWDPSTVKIDWALSEPVPWEAAALRDAGTVHVADDLDNAVEYSAEIAMRRLPSRPFLLFGQQAKADPTRAPSGADTAWAYTHVPRNISKDGAGLLETDEGRWLDGFVERMEERVEELAPGFRERIVGRHVFSPESMQDANANLDRGAINGGTAQLHQQLIFRPVPGWGRAETPISRLYLASSSAHPGGGVHGAPGANAARAALMAGAGLRSVVLGRGRLGERLGAHA
jgi:phytoene dehydrogenase-like protein